MGFGMRRGGKTGQGNGNERGDARYDAACWLVGGLVFPV